MNKWRKGIASWKVGDTLYISVPFTWLMPQARQMEAEHKGSVLIGGPGTMQPSGCPGFEPILFHNPCATFTSRGCPNDCGFCAVPKIEGEFRELDTWRPAPVICDNNLLACTWRHFVKVIDSLRWFDECDFNQGLDARLFTTDHAYELSRLKNPHIRFSWDSIKVESYIHDAVNLCRRYNLKNISIYVLIGYKDSPEDALCRLETCRAWGIRPNPMRYQPIDAEEKNAYIAPGWTEKELRKVMKYYAKLRWYEHIPYDEFDYLKYDKTQTELPL